MAQDKNMRMPSSGAGISSFSGEDHHSKLAISPTGVLIYVAIIIVAVLVLRFVA